MAYPNKIDDEKLKSMISDGKFMDEIAKEFDVVKGAVATRIKKLNLTPNYRRQSKGTAVSGPWPVAPAFGETPAQIIPVTLRLMIEVNVRINAQGCN